MSFSCLAARMRRSTEEAGLSDDIPIPYQLSKNDLDRRGLPIPFVVYRDMEGQPHFTVDDVESLNKVLNEKLCGLCGKPLKLGQMWMIGGPVSAFHAEGLYIEPPAHEECARYAIKVCPFLAAPNYARRIEAKTLKHGAVHDMLEVHNNRAAPPRPLFFALTRTSGVILHDAADGSGQQHVEPRRPWKHVEFWRNGEPITLAQAQALTESSDRPPSTLKWWPGSDHRED